MVTFAFDNLQLEREIAHKFRSVEVAFDRSSQDFITGTLRRAIDFTPPAQVATRRQQVAARLSAPAQGGAPRVSLIINRRRGRAGKPGLYGSRMKAASESFIRARQRKVGSLKRPLVELLVRMGSPAGVTSELGGTGRSRDHITLSRHDGITQFSIRFSNDRASRTVEHAIDRAAHSEERNFLSQIESQFAKIFSL